MKSLHLLALVVASTTTVFATPKPKDKPKPQTAEQKEADRHFKNGVALSNEGKYKEALAEFERAYELAPHPLVLYNIAGCHRELSNYAEAIKFYERFLDEGKGKIPANRLNAAQVELDGIVARIARVTVVVQGPPYATLSLDGQTIGTMPIPMPLVLSPGEHKLVARAEGHKDAERTLRTASGDEIEIELKLAEAPKVEVPRGTDSTKTVVTVIAKPAPKRFTIGAGFGTNLRQISNTGAPSLGLGAAIGSRVVIGVEGTLVAYAIMPSLRIRLAGDAVALHAVATVPIAFPGDSQMSSSSMFVAAAGGLGLRFRVASAFALRLDALASYAGKQRGTTFPTFLGGELWF